MSESGQNGRRVPSFVRSQESLAFEKMWRQLPRTGILPERSAFRPRLAKAFLRHVTLLQVPSPEDPTLRVRLAGDAISQQIGGNIVDQNFLDFIADGERKGRALEIVRELFERPCGEWWVSPVHYERGYSCYWEVTAFPLAGNEHSPAMILILVKPLDGILEVRKVDQRVVRMDPAVQGEIIDIT
jgi:hypothetical protein